MTSRMFMVCEPCRAYVPLPGWKRHEATKRHRANEAAFEKARQNLTPP